MNVGGGGVHDNDSGGGGIHTKKKQNKRKNINKKI